MGAMKVWIEKNMIPVALNETNQKFDNNIQFNRKIEKDGRAWRFTITVMDSKGKGASINPMNGKRIHACCYHVFYALIEELFRLGATRVKSSQMDVNNLVEFREAAYSLTQKNCVGSFYGFVSPVECCHCED